MKLFLRPAVVGFRSARACWTGQWPQPLSHGMEYALQTVVRVPLFAIFSQPTLPRFLQFPHSSQCRPEIIFFCLLGPDEAKYAASVPCLPCLPPSTVPSLPTGLLYRNHTFLLPAVRVTLLPPSSSSFRQLQLFQWIDHNVFVTSYSPATRTSFASFTPSVNAPGDQRGRGTRCFHLPGAPVCATVCADEQYFVTS